MRNYCTLFDRQYLSKGLVLHESLSRHSFEEFKLRILALDDETHWLLHDLQLQNVEIYPLSNFERAMNMEPVKQSRTWQEYCWTCASSWMEYLMPWVGEVTYLDADLCFFSDPAVVFEEIGNRSLGITPHRFPPERRHKEANGRYNVGLVYAKNTEAGRKCIAQWAKNCRAWCFNRIEGKNACGDQKYLDSWENDFPGEVCAIQNIGVNTAPWNVSQYQVNTGPTVDGVPVVFYHFHEFQNEYKLTGYPLRTQDRAFIYTPYVKAWHDANARIAVAEVRMADARREVEMEAQRA